MPGEDKRWTISTTHAWAYDVRIPNLNDWLHG